ncbi:hypothetical protein BD408DRAFT_423900 [Parasitella parasitica]|nr:hypothetical protein BD408DRAFT_423900 [Parasitella parasitica]
MSEANMDLPALSADESTRSSGDMSGGSINEHRPAMPPSSQLENFTQPLAPNNLQLEPQQHGQQQQQPAFMDQSFFYGLGQLASDNYLYFMQQQQQRQQEQQTVSLFQDQFLKEAASNENAAGSSSDNCVAMNGSSATLAHSIAPSMESFQAAVTTSVGEQPPSFWTGLNNFISNVTHNNIFPAFPNIARSFQEYLANHPVPFLSSFNAPTSSPASSPMPSSSMDFDPTIQFNHALERSDTGLQIRVLGIPQTGAKSRVETQIKLCIQLVTDGGDKAQWWSHLKLPEYIVTKDKLKKSSNSSNTSENGPSFNPDKTLYLQARVLCASDPTKKVLTCLGCIQRERKRSQRRKESKQQQNSDEAGDDRTDEDHSLAFDKERVLLFNCTEVVDFSAGDTILPTRITCYCRHHNERLGFCIYFEMLDHTGKKVAEGISPPIMITDDHKSSKVKIGSKRRRAESEVLPEPRIPSLSWIKSSLPFSGNNSGSSIIKTEPTHGTLTPGSSSLTALYPSTHKNFSTSSSSSITSSEIEDMRSVIKSMLTPTSLQQEQHQHIYSLTTPTNPSPSTTTTTTTATTVNNNNNDNTVNQPSSGQQQQPTMKRMIPNEAPTGGGIEITVLGINFRPGMTIMFGDKPATNIQYWSANTVICTLPPATQPGAVVVSFKEAPPTDKNDVMVFTYLVQNDRALMELALQVVGMKMTGMVEDARKIAMRIVQGNNNSSSDDNQLFKNAKPEAKLHH